MIASYKVTFSAYKTIVYALISVALFIFLFIESSNKGDFYIFLEASKDLMNHENIYQKTYFDGYHYFYSVLFALCIYPLTYLPSQVAIFLWLCFNIFLLYKIYGSINYLLPLHKLKDNSKKWFWILTFIFSFRFIFENIHYSQVTILLLYLCLEGVRFIQNKNIYKGAALIALGINIKLLPLVIIPYLIYRKQFKASGFIIIFYILFQLIPLLFIHEEYFLVLINTWAKLINPTDTKHILDVEERSFHSLTTLLSTLLVQNVPDYYSLNIKRNIFDISLHSLSTIILLVRLAFVMFTFYFLRTWPFQKNKNKTHRYWEISYILCLIPLIFPHQQHYAFLFIMPAFSYCLFYFLKFKTKLNKTKRMFIGSFLILIYIITNLKLLLGSFNEYYEHFKILTYGALFLIILLFVLVPPKATIKFNFLTN